MLCTVPGVRDTGHCSRRRGIPGKGNSSAGAQRCEVLVEVSESHLPFPATHILMSAAWQALESVHCPSCPLPPPWLTMSAPFLIGHLSFHPEPLLQSMFSRVSKPMVIWTCLLCCIASLCARHVAAVQKSLGSVHALGYFVSLRLCLTCSPD